MVALILSLLLIAFILFAEHAMPYMPIVPARNTSMVVPSDYGLDYETLDIEADSNLTLRGYFIHALTDPKATIILLHGISSNKENWLGYARVLADNGFNCVVYDQRAHGKSDGTFCTFGFYEKFDVSKIVDNLHNRQQVLPIGIQGASLGGAVALQALGHDKRLSFGIVESTFNTLENVVEEYGYDYFKFRSRWLARHVLSKSALIARFRPFEVKPVESCRTIEQPILMVHGDADEKIPMDFNKENFAALKSVDKEFFIVKGAGHDNVGEIGGADYRKKIFSFLNRIIKRPLIIKSPKQGKKFPKIRKIFKNQ
ncbi:MAG: alpha/beta fold hydrolase [Saprospiraceae bacterium]|nr:alpha/beta fold hydrolase [Saprospiraceae bacterium]